MKINPKYLFSGLAFVALLLFLVGPSLVSAANNFQILTCTGNYLSQSDIKKCQSMCDLLENIQHLTDLAVQLLILLIIPGLFVIAGIMYMISGVNPSLLSKAKAMMWSAAIGLGIVLSAYVMVNTVLTVVGNDVTTGVKWGSFQCNPEDTFGQPINLEQFKNIQDQSRNTGANTTNP